MTTKERNARVGLFLFYLIFAAFLGWAAIYGPNEKLGGFIPIWLTDGVLWIGVVIAICVAFWAGFGKDDPSKMPHEQ